MILVDTSIWIDHLNHGVAVLARLLDANEVLTHPFVVGELACGNLKNRSAVLDMMNNLYAPVVAEHHEVLAMIQQRQLMGKGIGYVDAHLLASTLLTPATRLWTRDRRLGDAATALGVGYQLD